MSDRPALIGGQVIFESFLPIFRPALPSYEDVRPAVEEMFRTGMLTDGPRVREFEERLEDHLGVKHAVAVSSCTLGLVLAMQALEVRGEVIVPSFTFMATVHPVVWNGAVPIFVDVNAENWNIDLASVEAAISERTSAIVGVHLLGTPAHIEGLAKIAHRHGLRLLFDSAHGFGALHHGKPLGGNGEAEVFSCTPTKVLPSADGGVVATNDDEIARRVRVGKNYGNGGNYDSEFVGLNARMTEFNAVVGMRSLERLENAVLKRNEIVSAYETRLGSLPGVTFQKVEAHDRSSRKELSLLIEQGDFGLDRDELAAGLRAEGIDTRFYYDPPVHTHQAFRDLATSGEDPLTTTMEITKKTITIPVYSDMTDEQAEGVCRAVERLHHHAEQVREQSRRGALTG